jgi:Ca-activated chloride channel homolog
MRCLYFLAAGLLCATAAAQQIQPQPVSVGIVFDSSGSMGAKLRYSREVVEQFLRTAGPQDEFLLVNFNDTPELASGPGANADEIRDRLAFIHCRGGSALFDAIALGVHEIRTAGNSRKAVLVISDGGDNHSRYTKSEITVLAREAGVKIYSVGIHDSFRARGQAELSGPAVLSDLAEQTGGKYFAADARLDKLPDLGAGIAAAMRAPIKP